MELIYGGSVYRLNLVNKSIPSTLISISKNLCYVKAKGYMLDMTYQLVVVLASWANHASFLRMIKLFFVIYIGSRIWKLADHIFINI